MNNKYLFIVSMLTSISLFAGEFPMDIGQEIIYPETSMLAPGNGGAIIITREQVERDLALQKEIENKQKEDLIEQENKLREELIKEEKEKPKRMAAGAIKSVTGRITYDKEKDGEYCSPCCQWASFYGCYAVFVAISAGISIWASLPTIPRDQSWCLGNVSPLTECIRMQNAFECFPASPLCPPHYKQL